MRIWGVRVTLPVVEQLPDRLAADQARVVLADPFWVTEAVMVDGPQVMPRSGTVTLTPAMVTLVVEVGVMVHGSPAVLTKAQSALPGVNDALVTDAVAPVDEVAPPKLAVHGIVVPLAVRLVVPVPETDVLVGVNVRADAWAASPKVIRAQAPAAVRIFMTLPH